jgi:hypothetical protein
MRGPLDETALLSVPSLDAQRTGAPFHLIDRCRGVLHAQAGHRPSRGFDRPYTAPVIDHDGDIAIASGGDLQNLLGLPQ